MIGKNERLCWEYRRIICGVQLIPLIGSILPTEIALKRILIRMEQDDKFKLNKIAARWPAKAMAQFFLHLIKSSGNQVLQVVLLSHHNQQSRLTSSLPMIRIPLSCLSASSFIMATSSIKANIHLRFTLYGVDFIMYEEIFNQIRSVVNKRNLKDSNNSCILKIGVAHFLNHTAKDIDALTTDDVDTFLTEKKLSGISPETYTIYHWSLGIRFFTKK